MSPGSPPPLRLLGLAAAIALQLGCALLGDTTPVLPRVDDPCAAWPEPGLYRVDIGLTPEGPAASGTTWSRRPYVVVPEDAGVRRGFVMVHGAGGTGDRMIAATAFADEAEARGLIAAFPSGTGTVNGYTWNAGSCCGYAESMGIDDVTFLSDLAAALRDQLCLQEVLAVGYSNGGMMVNRWACEGDGIDAVASAAGPYLGETCESPALPVAVWHGTADERVPFDGGEGGGEGGEIFPAAPDAFDALRVHNKCGPSPDAGDTEGALTCDRWSAAPCAAPAVFCTLDGWSHELPSGRLGSDLPGPAWERWALDWFDEVVPPSTPAL